MKIIKLLILTLFVALYANDKIDLYSQDYIDSIQEHLHKKFDSSSDTMPMECHGQSCKFDIYRQDHLGAIIGILFVAFLLISGSIGSNSDSIEASWVGSMGSVRLPVSQKKKNEIDAQPIYWGRALLIFVVALVLIKYIRASEPSKIIDFATQELHLQNRDFETIQSYPLSDIKQIEILKYNDTTYKHYELNLQLSQTRINLYTDTNDEDIIKYAQELSNKLKKPIVKIKTNI